MKAKKKCKHQNGEFLENSIFFNSRDIKNGIIESEGINNQGDIIGYSYTCNECGKIWKAKVPYDFPKTLSFLYDFM